MRCLRIPRALGDQVACRCPVGCRPLAPELGNPFQDGGVKHLLKGLRRGQWDCSGNVAVHLSSLRPLESLDVIPKCMFASLILYLSTILQAGCGPDGSRDRNNQGVPLQSEEKVNEIIGKDPVPLPQLLDLLGIIGSPEVEHGEINMLAWDVMQYQGYDVWMIREGNQGSTPVPVYNRVIIRAAASPRPLRPPLAADP